MSVRKAGAQNPVNAKNAGGSARVMRLQLGSGDQNGNKVSRGSDKASSPDSTRSSGSFSSSSRESPADVEMVDCCLNKEVFSEVFPTGIIPAEPGLVSAPFPALGPAPFHRSGHGLEEGFERPESAGKPTSLYLDARPDNWNDNLALVMTSLRDEGRHCGGEASGRSSDTSPDSAVSEAGGVEPAIPSHGDNDRASPTSISSGEMVLRKNSFSLTDSGSDNLLSTSFLSESAVPSLAPSELGTSLIVLPDVCEGLREKEHQAHITGDDVDSQHGKLTFFHRPGGEDAHLATGEGPLGLLSEMEGKDAAVIHAERECSSPALLCRTYIESEPLQCSSGACTPVEGGTFLILGSEDSDTSCNAQTSTPVQGSVSNKTFCLPSLSESPFRGDRGEASSPAGRAQNGRPLASVSPSPAAHRTPAISRKPVVSRTPTVSRTPVVPKTPTLSANKQTDAKRFPQPDPKNPKSKIVSRPAAPLKAPTPSKPTLPDQNALAGNPARRKGEAGNRHKRRGSSFTQSSGATEKPRPRRASECEAALRSKAHRDVAISLQGEAPTRGDFNINNVTFNAVTTPPQQGQQKKAGQGAGTLGGAIKPSEADPRKNGTTVELCAVNQEVRSVSIAAAADGGKSKLGQRPSPGRARGTSSSSQTPSASLRPPPPASKPSSSSKDGRTSGSMSASRTKNTPAAGNSKMRLTERPSITVAATPGAKPASGPGLAGPRPGGVSRLPVKSQDHSEPGAATGSTQASVPAPCKTDAKPARPVAPGGPAARLVGKPPITKAGGVRAVVRSPQRKALTAGIKNAALPNQTPSKTAASPLQRSGSGRFQRQATAPQVDKNRPRASPRAQPPAPAPGQPDLLPTETKAPGTDRYRARCESSNKYIQQLKRLLVSGNRRFEAVAVVIQHIVTEHEEAVKQKQQLAQELLTLRGELVTSTTSCETLEREKDELRAAFEGVLQKVQEQHQSDMADLEERLKTFYAAEWEKVHQAYQEEADKCRTQMEQQLDDVKSKHEALRRELEDGHVEELQSLKLHYEMTVEELRKTHKEEMETLDKTLKEAEAKLTEQMEELAAENNALNEKLKAEEERRRILAEKNQKDSHTLYLEQELESLKVVLDIKNKQLHQQDKKLMQMDKLMEKSVKLDECLKKVQQENEDLKARMDKHAALSRQLSTEQAVLQESLQKESKVNKRLSMENEELLWKLHNGDLSSPRKLSPTSPSKSFQSPRNSGVFSSAPVSPR